MLRIPGTDQGGVVLALEGDVQILVVIGEVSRRRPADGNPVPGHVLPEIGDYQFRFTGAVRQEIRQPGRPAYLRDSKPLQTGNRLFTRCRTGEHKTHE